MSPSCDLLILHLASLVGITEALFCSELATVHHWGWEGAPQFAHKVLGQQPAEVRGECVHTDSGGWRRGQCRHPPVSTISQLWGNLVGNDTIVLTHLPYTTHCCQWPLPQGAEQAVAGGWCGQRQTCLPSFSVHGWPQGGSLCQDHRRAKCERVAQAHPSIRPSGIFTALPKESDKTGLSPSSAAWIPLMFGRLCRAWHNF